LLVPAAHQAKPLFIDARRINTSSVRDFEYPPSEPHFV
jgi:hypothetical protein